MEEIWKDIEDYEGIYQISNLGRVKSLQRNIKHWRGGISILKERIIMPDIAIGYQRIELRKNNIGTNKLVHRLIASAFIPNPENKPYINHINGIKTDNRIENLEWCSQLENMRHAHKTGLIKHEIGEKNPLSKLTDKDILYIRNNYDNTRNYSKIMADKYCVSWFTINNILKRKSWNHI